MQIKKESLYFNWRTAAFPFSARAVSLLIFLLMTVSAANAQIWEDFTVWYDGNGADSGHISEEKYESGSNDITLKQNAASAESSDTPYVKNGCTFLGWSLASDNGSVIMPILPEGTVWDPVDVPVTWDESRSGFVFYARWECDPNLVTPTPIPPTPTLTPSRTPLPTVTPTAASLLIAPDGSPTATAIPVYQSPTSTPSLLIYPNRPKFPGEFDAPDPLAQKSAGGNAAAWNGSPHIPNLFSSADGELTKLPETGITSAAGYLRSRIPASVSYTPTRMELLIPSLDISSSIVYVESGENGYPVQWLEGDTGLLADSSLPGEGFSILAAHNTLDADTFGPFALINALRKGDRFFIRTVSGELMIFEVYANEKINEYDYGALYHAGAMYENTVTLMTCEDERPEGGYMNRRIVSARKIN